mgnify:CR=1 FL=1
MYYKALPDSETYQEAKRIMDHGKECHKAAKSLCLELFGSDEKFTNNAYKRGKLTGVKISNPGPEMYKVRIKGYDGFYLPRRSKQYPNGAEAANKLEQLEKVPARDLFAVLGNKGLGGPGVILSDEFLLIQAPTGGFSRYEPPADVIEILGSEFSDLRKQHEEKTKSEKAETA